MEQLTSSVEESVNPVADPNGMTGKINHDSSGRPSEMGMAIQSGILKSLGINLYTNLGKVLVEFIANAYDSDASSVSIEIPVLKIEEERAKLAAARKEEAARKASQAAGQLTLDVTSGQGGDGAIASGNLDLSPLHHTLPSEVQVVIADDGHGMTWEEVEKKFLPLNRQRRADRSGRETNLTSPGGRYVMGRKGVGKLAGFGAALSIELWTKREGETFATRICLVDEDLSQAGSIQDIRIPVTYEDGLPPETKGTRVTLSRLKAEATRDTIDKIRKVIAKSFHAIRPQDFSISLNGEPLSFDLPGYEFIYPSDLNIDAVRDGKRATAIVEVPELGSMSYRYYVGFLPRSHGSGADRGATVYCNNRLAAGPALFGLPTGMHSFHSVDYMDCIIEADELDRNEIDFVNTARNGIKEGNEVVAALLESIVGVMRSAISAHARFKEGQTRTRLQEDPTAKIIASTIETLPKKTRKAGRRLLETIAQTFEVGTPEFEELAPVIIHSINATEVLIKLVSHGTDVGTIGQIMEQLRELSEIEKRDALKLYRARRGGIEKLEIMYERGQENWKKRQFEKELHLLFKENPWLIRPEFSTYISSDQGINTTVSRLAKHLGVDEHSSIKDGDEESDVRPDLVFLMSDPTDEGPYTIKIVELKSPALPLNLEHWRQLEDYILSVRDWCKANITHAVRINGYLIGTMPKTDASKQSEKNLLEKFRQSGPNDEIQIIGLLELIRHAKTIHVEAIAALNRDLNDEDEESPGDEPSTGSQPDLTIDHVSEATSG